MILCIDGSDITRLVLAAYDWLDGTLSDSGWCPQTSRTFDVGPEGYLAAIAEFIGTPDALKGIVLVQGPGSATSLRTSITIANALAVTHNVLLYGIPHGRSFASVFATAEGPTDGVAFLEPMYQDAARITETKKDPLRRRTS